MLTAIECVHDGHVGGPKQYNDFPLGNIFYFYANIFYCFSPPTGPPCTHSIDKCLDEMEEFKGRDAALQKKAYKTKVFKSERA